MVLAFNRVINTLRTDLDRLDLTGMIGPEHIFNSRKTCLAAYHHAATATDT